jgi:phosphate transport system permease protein
MNLRTQRKIINAIAMMLSLAAMAFGLFWLIWILWMVFAQGLSSLSWTLLTENTPPPGSAGGLKNAIVGSAIMVGLAMLMATPVAIMAGIYLAEYGRRTWLGQITRFVNDILLSAPSIVIGLFVYAVYVAQVGKFSGFSGAVALALLVIPVVVRTTEDMLILVPNALREAAFALGAPKWKVIMMISLRAAKTGVITGILLALARISGETAPLLFWPSPTSSGVWISVSPWRICRSPFSSLR